MTVIELKRLLCITCGLPRSGKSTIAKQMARSGWVRVCPDDYRLGLYGQQMIQSAEPTIWAAVKLSVRAFLIGGNEVVIDYTGATRSSRAEWKRLAAEMGVGFFIIWIDTPFPECQRRNHGPGSIPNDRLIHFYDTFEAPDDDEAQVIRHPWHATDGA